MSIHRRMRWSFARRKEPDPSARSHPTRTADQTRALPNHDARLQAARHHHPVCRLSVLDGTVIGRCMQRHRHSEFIRFLNAIEREVPADKLIHVVLDNYATHKHPKVLAWLTRHPRWTFHFTPTSASWLNAVENFFSKMTGNASDAASFARSPTSGRHQRLSRRAQRQSQTVRLDQIRRCYPSQTQPHPCTSRLSQLVAVIGNQCCTCSKSAAENLL